MKRELGIARCGLACCLCSENDKCNGCNSGECPDKQWCENRKCSTDMGIKHCYECDKDCKKGLLGKIKPYAFTLFVKKYGEEYLLDCLERNEKNGVVYHREGINGDYDDFDSVEKLFEFIKTGEKNKAQADMKITFKKAEQSDAKEQLAIQKAAFMPLLNKYNDDENPANMPLEEMQGKIENPFGAYYVIKNNDKSIGGIYAYPIDDKYDIMYLCSIYISPDYQGKSVAQQAIRFVEDKFKSCKKWVLEVPEMEYKNIHLYEKFGYKKTDEKEKINDKLTIVTYVKTK